MWRHLPYMNFAHSFVFLRTLSFPHFPPQHFTSDTASQMAVRVENVTYTHMYSRRRAQWIDGKLPLLSNLTQRRALTAFSVVISQSNRSAADRCLLSCKSAHTPPICASIAKPRYTWKRMKYVHVYTPIIIFQYCYVVGSHVKAHTTRVLTMTSENR